MTDSVDSIKQVTQEVSRIVSELAGIQLGVRQQPMVENRLRTRMLRLGLDQFHEYLKYLKDNLESESQALLSLLTTHHTYFFREFSHFEFLLTKALPELIPLVRARADKTLKVWSAAASRGQEVYSLAMFLEVHLSKLAPDLKYEIWGTDVDPESVQQAANGVYKVSEVRESPAMYTEACWIRGQGEVSDFMKIRTSIRAKCQFGTANLLKAEEFLQKKEFDVVFCRNVYIYFNPDQIKQATTSILKHLQPKGFFIIGVSESLSGLGLSTELVGPSIYRHKSAVQEQNLKTVSAPPVVGVKALPSVIQVLAVDDSATILTLLKKIMTPDKGFEIKATAKNGQEALDILKTKKFDVITLDLHMPQLDGVGFLEEYRKLDSANRIPVVVVSSISRDDAGVAQKALSLGALDYVEKPSLESLIEAGNQIRAKIRTVLQSSAKAVNIPKNFAEPPALSKPSKSNSSLSSKTSRISKSSKIKVLVVDDSKTIRNLIHQILSGDPVFEVVAMAEKPSEVEGLIEKHKPDLLTLDIHMPEMDGVTLLKRIHPKYRIPTVMISSVSMEEGPLGLQALESGAVDYIKKPEMSQMVEKAPVIRERLKVAAQANLSRRQGLIAKKANVHFEKFDSGGLVVMGASTGGTEALRVVLESLPSQIPPILIVQHIPAVFSKAFADRLNRLCPFEVREAQDGDLVKPNLVLVAPGGAQMKLVRESNGALKVRVNDDPPMNRHKPSVDYTFRSVAEASMSNVTAVILTGMGADGAREMKTLRDSGARTIAQDEATCVVFGMPREAIAKGGVEFTLPLDQIPEQMIKVFNSSLVTKIPVKIKAG
jgi:chemotaxis response regulator CheB/chemotaxis methyl-accepting protein methylase